MTENPLLTICVPTYNSEKFLEKSLKSIVNQDYSNFEILVSDNGSTDNTVKMVESHINSSKNSRISLRHNLRQDNTEAHYMRCFYNCNGCLNSGLINGDFVAFYHSNDVLEPNIARKEVEFLIKNPEVRAVFTLGKIINEKNKVINKFTLPKELAGKNVFTFKEILNAILKHGNIFLVTPTFMARRELFEKIGLFADEKFCGTSCDLEMWLRILEKYPIGILSEELIYYRVGGMSTRYNHLRTQKADFFIVMDHFLKSRGLMDAIDKKLLRQYAYQKDFDNTLRAMNFLIKNEIAEAKKLINNSFSPDVFRAFFENIKIIRIKVMALKIILWIGINAGLGKTLGKILYKKIS